MRSLPATLLAALLLAAPALAQEPLPVETTLPPDGWVDADDAIEIRFGRALAAPEERVAVFFDHVDVTDLFRPTDGGLVYDAGGPALPRGEGELVVWQVTPAGWTEALRAPLKVRGRLGFETSEWDPGVDLGVEGRVARGEDPEPDPFDDGVDQDLAGQLAFRTTHTRGDLAITSETTFLGSSSRKSALRFSEEGKDAPKVDLSAYRVELRRGDAALAVGHVGFGEQKHLINGFNSRGALLTWSPVERVDFSFAAMNGNSVVGWENFVGLEEPDHRVASASIGIDALERPGGLRLELTWLDASILPATPGFNQGDIDDAEESGGLALRLATETPGRRLRLEGGFSRSTYDNPFDPTLAQGDDLVEVEEETRNARYVEASAGLLKGVKLGETRTADLDLVLRHEQVDPEYQSVGAFARADQRVNDVALRGRVAGVQIQASHARTRDNLDDVASVLTTKTRRSGASLGTGVAELFGVTGGGKTWLPQIQYRWDRTHQFGEGVPENSGFSASHVPDQVSVQQGLDVAWRWSKVTAGWKLGLSDQDNRQEGRENADLENRTHAFALGVRPHARVSIDLSLNLERREAKERDQVDLTRRWGVRSSLNVLEASRLALTWSATHAEDEADTKERDNTSLDLQWSSAVPGLDRFGGQWFLRLSRSTAESLDRVLERDDERSDWNLDSGLNFTFFQ
jgi:hypothetical protein